MQNQSALNLVLGYFMGFVLLFAGPAAPAEEARPQQPAAAQTTVGDSDLRAFAKAYVDYHKIRQTYEPQVRKAKTPKEKDQIQKEGNAKVKQALEKQGLTAQSYNRLFTAVNGNETLRQKALKFINQERTKS
jgi:hypothetical protein